MTATPEFLAALAVWLSYLGVVMRDLIEYALRGAGLSDRPDLYDSSIHSWRCEHPDRYGHCTCFQDLIDDLVKVFDEVR